MTHETRPDDACHHGVANPRGYYGGLLLYDDTYQDAIAAGDADA